MKKVLSMILALVMILSIGTVGASAVNSISVSGKPYHVREGNYAYFPLTYDCDIPYGSYADWDEKSETKVIFPYGYASDILKPVDVIPSELLYNMGGTVEIIKDDTFVFPNGTTTRSYIYVEVNFKGFEGIEEGAVLFNVKFEVIKEEFFVDGYLRDNIFDSFYIVDSGNISTFTFCEWKITKSDGTEKDISKNMEPSLYATFEGVYEDLLITDYEPFIPNIEILQNETDEFTFTADEVKTCIFTPKQSGNYKITVTSDSKAAVEIEVYSQTASGRLLDKGFVLTTDEKYYYGINLKQLMAGLDTEKEEFMYMNARANRDIVLKLSDASSIAREALSGFNSLADYFVPSTVTVTVEAVELEPIRPGHRPHISHKNVFEFVPERTGNYRFTSELTGGAIPNVKICDYTGCVATSETFVTASSETNLNFDVIAELQAGETYLVHCENDAVNEENEPVGSFSVEVEDITKEADVTNVTYIQQEATHKTFTVTVNGRKQMIQFIEPDGGTRTYDRYHKNVKITSYNSDGQVVSSMARDLAYEVWEIYSNMSVGVEINVRGKENYKWDEGKYSFVIEPYNPIVSMELSATSGKKGAVPATVVADAKTEKVMFKMPNGTSVTVSTFTTDKNGNHVFTGKAWMNEDGANEIQVLIRRDNVWKQAGTLVYTVE